MFDVIIIGGGPAGLSAALTCEKLKLRYLLLEQDKIGTTIRMYRKDKLIQKSFLGKATEIKGYLWFGDCYRDELIKKWEGQTKKLNIHENEEAIDIRKNVVITNKNKYETKNIILCIGKQGNPRKLGIVGEDKCKVLYTLSDSSKYNDADVLVVGGGDAAVEVALSLSKNNRVTLSYRKEKFFRLTLRNQDLIDNCKNIKIIFNSNLVEVKDKEIIIEVNGVKKEMKNDVIFLLLGFDLPMEFLRKTGIKIKNNNPIVKNYESSIKNLYIIGDLVGLPRIIDAINEGNEVVKIIKNNLK